MNVHHLESFYYVARYGGISRAVRHIPYGIQQPAVSGQLRQLEQHLGVPLFTRVPFALTREVIVRLMNWFGTARPRLRSSAFPPAKASTETSNAN